MAEEVKISEETNDQPEHIAKIYSQQIMKMIVDDGEQVIYVWESGHCDGISPDGETVMNLFHVVTDDPYQTGEHELLTAEQIRTKHQFDIVEVIAEYNANLAK